MRPPICEVCRRHARDTVSFADYESLPEGMVGHPRGLGWFCRWHLRAARALSGRTMDDAVRRLRFLTGMALSVLTLMTLVLVSMLVFT